MEHGAVGLPHELLAALPEELRALLANDGAVQTLQQHAALLRACRTVGIAQAYARLTNTEQEPRDDA